MSDSPPPYSQLELDDDPFVDSGPTPVTAPVPSQPYGAQPRPINYRALHGYGSGIPAPEDLVMPAIVKANKKWYTVSAGTEIVITQSWGIAANRSVGVPGGLYKSQNTWEEAVAYYTELYRDGSIKLIPSAAPAGSAPAVNSTTTTPVPGSSSMPINVVSSPIAAPVSPTPVGRNSTTNAPHYTPAAGDRNFPIFVTSSPIATPNATNDSDSDDRKADIDDRKAETVRRHEYLNHLFTEVTKKKSTLSNVPATPLPTPSLPTPSAPAAWRDTTPVSIPGAMRLRSLATPATSNHREHTPPSTPTKVGKGKAKATTDDELSPNEDAKYFPNPLTEEDWESIFEWEQAFELQQALSSPRFDQP